MTSAPGWIEALSSTTPASHRFSLASRIAIVAPTEWPTSVSRSVDADGVPQRGQRRGGIVGLLLEAGREVIAGRPADTALIEAKRSDTTGDERRGESVGDVQDLSRHVRVAVERA